jgi:DNA-binding GntR family transcriptional regulator
VPGPPAYQRVADDLRRRILGGELAEGSRVPSLAQITMQYTVSDPVARAALRVLAGEGLIESRPGSGTYVRPRPALRRLTADRYRRGGSSVSREVAALGAKTSWEYRFERAQASEAIAARLGIQPGEQVMRTSYVFRADGAPAQLSTSWEPMWATGGTPVLLPERGPYAGRGVMERMAAIGLPVTRVVEEVSARLPTVPEAAELDVPVGLPVLVIERTHWSESRPVETADIVVPGDRARSVYEIPLDPPPTP